MNQSPRRDRLFAASPGRRFIGHFRRKRHERGNGIARRVIFGGGGTLVAFVGFVLLFIPGPGVLLLVIGAALIAQQSERAARLLDWLEIRAHRIGRRALGWWAGTSTVLRAALILGALVLAGAVAWAGYVLFLAWMPMY